jgi:hypothetical protein
VAAKWRARRIIKAADWLTWLPAVGGRGAGDVVYISDSRPLSKTKHAVVQFNAGNPLELRDEDPDDPSVALALPAGWVLCSSVGVGG